ncbi:hypothetical protein BJX63DRAFT_389530, partial [Aspergillus granulosus]
MHHFIEVTSLTIRAVPQQWQLHWRNALCSVVQSSTFLLHGVVALGALHLASMSPAQENRYLQTAAIHHFKAIDMFRCQVSSLHGRNEGVALWFSILSTINELGFISNPNCLLGSQEDAIDRLLLVFSLIRKHNRLVQSTSKPWTSSFNRLMQDLLHLSHEHMVLSDVSAVLRSLEDLNHHTTADPAEESVYSHAIYVLGANYYLASVNPNEWAVPILWANAVSQQYLELLQVKKPMALLILALYCLLVLRNCPARWWMQWWEHILEAVQQLLGGLWRDFLSCALRFIQTNGDTKGNFLQQASETSFSLHIADIMSWL